MGGDPSRSSRVENEQPVNGDPLTTPTPHQEALELAAQRISDELSEIAPSSTGADIAFVVTRALQNCTMSVETDGRLKMGQCLQYLIHHCETMVAELT